MNKSPQAKARAKEPERDHYLLRLFVAGNGANSQRRWPTFVTFARSTWKGVIRLKRLMWFRTLKQRSATTS